MAWIWACLRARVVFAHAHLLELVGGEQDDIRALSEGLACGQVSNTFMGEPRLRHDLCVCERVHVCVCVCVCVYVCPTLVRTLTLTLTVTLSLSLSLRTHDLRVGACTHTYTHTYTYTYTYTTSTPLTSMTWKAAQLMS